VEFELPVLNEEHILHEVSSSSEELENAAAVPAAGFAVEKEQK
jgi:hypothetical protein